MKNLLLILALIVTSSSLMSQITTSNSLMPQILTTLDKNIGKYYLNNQYDNALKSITKTIKKKPNNSDNYYERASINFVLENYDVALIDINTAIRLTPSKYIYYLAKAQIEITIKGLDTALKTIDEAKDLDSSMIMAYILKSRFYFDLGNYDTAIKEYQNAIEINNRFNPNLNKSEMKNSHFFMGLSYLAKNDLSNALTEINKSLIDTFRHKTMLIYRAKVYYLSDQLDQANIDFQKVTKISIDTLQKAIAYAYLGDKEMAIQTVNSFKRINQVNLTKQYHVDAAAVYCILKEYDIALDYLDKIKHFKQNYTEWILNNPDFKNLKNDERFLAIISKMKINHNEH